MSRATMFNPFLATGAVLGALFIGATIALAQDAASPGADGEVEFNNACRTCHSIKPGDNRLGPSLGGIVGKKSGASEGFGYSAALKGGQITWDEATLDAFIANPDKVAQGNGMKPYAGIADEAQRAKIISFLKTGGTAAD